MRGIRVPQAAAQFSRKRIDELTEFVKKDFGAQGLVWFRVQEGGTLDSSAAKNFTPEMLANAWPSGWRRSRVTSCCSLPTVGK